jgi:UDP-N-acetylmuramate dehydrogenase
MSAEPTADGDSDVARSLSIAARMLGSRATAEAPFGARTTYRVGGTARLGLRIDGIVDLIAVTEVMLASAVPVLVLGKGSNTLVADRGFDGLLIWMGAWAGNIEIVGTDVVAGGAVSLPVLARRTAAESLTGLEWAVGVPGSVGGAVRMNAGGHGSDVAGSICTVRVFDLVTGHDVEMNAPELDLGFRRSVLRDTDVVIEATFALQRGDRHLAEADLAEIVRWRREHQPGGQNAGSVFANFIQADEHGSADDVAALIELVRTRVEATSGHLLRSEIRMVGFDPIGAKRAARTEHGRATQP